MKISNMGSLLIFLWAIFSGPDKTTAQNTLAENAPLIYTDVVYMADSSATKDELYYRAKSWMNQTFKDAKEVIQIDNKEAGEITGKGAVPFDTKNFMAQTAVSGVIRFTVSIYLKDGRYKYVIKDFTHDPVFYTSISPVALGLITNSDKYPYLITNGRGVYIHKVWKELQQKSQREAQYLITSLQESMVVQTETGNSDW